MHSKKKPRMPPPEKTMHAPHPLKKPWPPKKPRSPPPPWTELLTHASENITLPQTSFEGGKYGAEFSYAWTLLQNRCVKREASERLKLYSSTCVYLCFIGYYKSEYPTTKCEFSKWKYFFKKEKNF